MDTTSLASSLIGAQAGALQMAVAARLMKTSMDQQAATVQQLLAPAQQGVDALANVAAGIGGSLDISV